MFITLLDCLLFFKINFPEKNLNVSQCWERDFLYFTKSPLSITLKGFKDTILVLHTFTVSVTGRSIDLICLATYLVL